jgi:hypothetical protein
MVNSYCQRKQQKISDVKVIPKMYMETGSVRNMIKRTFATRDSEFKKVFFIILRFL